LTATRHTQVYDATFNAIRRNMPSVGRDTGIDLPIQQILDRMQKVCIGV
jgi:hypothetical protein